MTCRIANVLKSHGVSKGDRVGVYLPMCPTAAAVMLACARIGNFNTEHDLFSYTDYWNICIKRMLGVIQSIIWTFLFILSIRLSSFQQRTAVLL